MIYTKSEIKELCDSNDIDLISNYIYELLRIFGSINGISKALHNEFKKTKRLLSSFGEEKQLCSTEALLDLLRNKIKLIKSDV